MLNSNYTCDLIKESGIFTLSLLDQTCSFETIRHFGFQSGREVDKFADYTAYQNAENGVPYITEGTNAYLAVKVSQTVDLGSHTMFIGEVTEMEVLSEEPSANYEYYQEEVKPKPEEVGKTADGQTVWRCTICGYEYVGDTNNVDVHIAHLRAKIEDAGGARIIQTVRGVGYVCRA